MNLLDAIANHRLILTEASIIEILRRSGSVTLHPRLANTLLIYDGQGSEALARLYNAYIAIAFRAAVPLLIMSPTWRANRARLEENGITNDVNADAVAFLRKLRESWGDRSRAIFIGGLMGCKNDCYRPDEALSSDEAYAFHSWQAVRLAAAGADFIIAETLPSIVEASGIARAIAETALPYFIGFVINQAGSILDGTTLEDAITGIDASCPRPPTGYMITCAYPSFLKPASLPLPTLSRIIGYCGNASSLDHAQLDGALTLHADSLSDWGDRMLALNEQFGIRILGGCCGTDERYLDYLVTNRHMSV